MKLKQIFCRHKKLSPYLKCEKYLNLSGETVYWKCDRCDKIVKSEFYTNEEFILSFRFSHDQDVD